MDKKQLLTMLKNEFTLWEELLASLSEKQIIAPKLPSDLSIKDVIAHLWLWQQRSIERLEAALQNREPAFPGWPEGLDPESEDDVDRVNAWIHATCQDKPWPSVYRDWREGFLQFMELAEAIPEKDLLEAGKYPWMEGGALALVLWGAYDHHHEEHLEPLLAWLHASKR